MRPIDVLRAICTLALLAFIGFFFIWLPMHWDGPAMPGDLECPGTYSACGVRY